MAAVVWSRRVSAWGPPFLLFLLVTSVLVLLGSRLITSPNRPARPVLVASGDWAPFVGADLPDGGPLARLVTEVLERQGYAPEIRFTTWSLALQRTSQQSVIGSFPFVGSEERRSDYLLSDDLLQFQYVLFVRADDVRTRGIATAEDLDGLSVAHIEGYDYWPELNQAVEAEIGGFTSFESKEAAFDALASGEVDIVPEGLLSGDAVLTAPDFAGDAGAIVHLEPGTNSLLGSVEGLHFMLAPTDANKEFIASFDRRLAEVKDTEMYKNLVTELDSVTSADIYRLRPLRGQGIVQLTDSSGRTVLTPAGTSARVLAWPPEFTQGAREPGEVYNVQVKVLDGPSRGRILFVDARSLIIGELP